MTFLLLPLPLASGCLSGSKQRSAIVKHPSCYSLPNLHGFLSQWTTVVLSPVSIHIIEACAKTPASQFVRSILYSSRNAPVWPVSVIIRYNECSSAQTQYKYPPPPTGLQN